MRNNVYTITVLNWNKYNSTLKRGHKSTLISNNFCDDGKLGALPVTVRWLFLGILLTCGDHTRDTVEINERRLRELLESSWSIERALEALQSLQLVRYTKNEFLLNRIEKNRIEKKRKENNSQHVKNVGVKKEKIDDVDDRFVLAKKEVWNAYSKSYENRWGVVPRRNAAVNKQIENFVKRLGNEDSPKVIEFYCQHKDSFYVKKAHPFSLALKDAESLYTQWKKGVQITQTKIREYERKSSYQEMMEQIDLQAQQELQAERGV